MSLIFELKVHIPRILQSGVKAMEELDEATAYDFISTCVKGLSEDTAKRRSTTLIKWLNTLKPYRRKYSCNNEE